MPDLNTLPTSKAPSMSTSASPHTARPRRISITAADASRPSPPSPRSPSLSSLQAAATINAGLQSSPVRHSPSLDRTRRRSSLMNNLTLNDSTQPAPGELQQSSGSKNGSPRLGRRSFAFNTADPHHQRQPSLGEMHQELESEQEAQVNRLLHMIRVQQDQLAAMRRQQNPSHTELEISPAQSASAAMTEASSSRSTSVTTPAPAHQHFNRPHSLSRRSSALVSTPGSRGTSPALPPQPGSLGPLTEDFLLGGTRDENAFYQAETQMLTRENQMLKARIRELERQISELGGTNGTSTPNQAHSHSPLASMPPTFTAETHPTIPTGIDLRCIGGTGNGD